uniref:Peptidase S74 domain-containing protein n=4 Tax=unclassified bacterial viruses TaxID=12333 RepID=A0AAU6W179_9VIRU
MAYSTQRAVSDGTLQLLMIALEFFDKSEISVYLNNAPTTAYTWATDKSIRMDAVVPQGVELMFRRTTDLSQVRHVFSSGAQFKDSTLDDDFKQILHIAQEAVEGANVGDIYADLNMHGNRVLNVGPAIADGDAVSLGQVKTESASAWVAASQARINNEQSFINLQQAEINNAQSLLNSEASLVNNQQSFTNLEQTVINNAQSLLNRTASEVAAATAKAEADRAVDANTSKQDQSPVLTDLAALEPAANQIPVSSGARGFAMKPITALAQNLIASQSQADMRTVLGLSKAGATRLFNTEVVTPATLDDGLFWGFKADASGDGNGNKCNMFSLVVQSDQVRQRDGVNGMTGLKVEGLGVRHLFGGGPTEGGRHAGGFLLQQVAATASTNKDRNYVGVQGHVITTSGDGGTDGAPQGAYFAGSGFTAILNDAYNVMNATSWEFNTYIMKGTGANAGKRVNIHTGLQIASYIEERGYGLDTAISVGCLSPSPLGFKYGMTFSSTHGAPAFGADSTAFKLLPSCSPTGAIDAFADLVGVTTNALIRTSTTELRDQGLRMSRANVGLTLGTSSASSVVTLKALTSGLNSSYDFQLTFSSGSASIGKGVLQLEGDAIIVPFGRPDGDATRDWGASNFRFKTFWASTSTINTSDARKKTAVRKLSASELAAAKDLSREVGMYQWLDSVKDKGENARLFCGMTVQRAMEVMASHYLDPFKYSFICYDKWDYSPAVYNTDEEGVTTLIHPEILAGDLYSFRLDDLQSFLIAGLNARLEAAGI